MGVAWSAVLAVVCLLPLVLLLVRALDLSDGTFVLTLREASTQQALLKSAVVGVLTGSIAVAIALPAAWFSQVTDMPGARHFRVLLILPLAIPSYVSGFVVVAALASNGWLHTALRSLGLELQLDPYSLGGVLIALSFTYPLALLQIQAALRRTDPALWEASRTLGASSIRTFRQVIMPVLRAPMASGGLLVGLYSIGDFGAVSLLRYESLSYLVYLRHKSLFAREEVIPLSLLLALVALLLAGITLLAGGKTAQSSRTISVHRQWPTIELGRWRWVAFAFCASLVVFFLILPTAVVFGWLVGGVSLGAELELPWREAWNSIAIGCLAALILTVAALGPAIYARFGDPRGAQALRAAAFVGYALPGIVVALAMVSFAVKWMAPAYQTTGLMVFAYAIRFTPLALGAMGDGLNRLSVGLVESARTLGAGKGRVLFRVVLPCAAPAVAAAFLGVFLAVVKELPVSLILGPLEYASLATRIWTLSEDAYYALASVPVLAMLIVALTGLLVGRRLSE